MGSMFTIGYSIILVGAGIYAILLGHDLLPKSKNQADEDNSVEPNRNKIQYTIAGIILIYFGLSTIYALWS